MTNILKASGTGTMAVTTILFFIYLLRARTGTAQP